MAKIKTKERKKIFLEILKKTAGNITQACEKAGIARRTFYNWIEKDKKFKEQYEEIQESIIDWAESLAYKKMKDGDTTMIIFFLKTKAKHRGWTEKVEIQHSGKIERTLEDFYNEAEIEKYKK